jgi:hypothetical protein
MNACFIVRNALRIGLLLTLVWTAPTWADSITASVRNETTGRPSAGDQVVLLLPAHGLEKESETTTDDKGAFTLPVRLPGAQYVIRIVHGNVNYDFSWNSGSSGTTPQIKVYDAAPKVSGLTEFAMIVKVESEGANYVVTEMHAIVNELKPPRTQVGLRNLEIYLPQKAEIVSAIAAGPQSSAAKVTPAPEGTQPGRYAIGFPLFPGMTRYAIRYRVASSVPIVFSPRLNYPTGQLSVIFPQSMKFTALAPNRFCSGKGKFHRIIDREGVQVQAMSQLKAGQMPAFALSGSGMLPVMQNATTPASTFAAAVGAAITHPSGHPTTSPAPAVDHIDLAALGIIGTCIALGFCIVFAKANRERRQREIAAANGGISLKR